MWVFLSLKSGFELHFIMFDPTGEPQASDLESRGLGELDSDLYLGLTYWLIGLRPHSVGPTLYIFMFRSCQGGPGATALRSGGTLEVDWPSPRFGPIDSLGTGPRALLDQAFLSLHGPMNNTWQENTYGKNTCQKHMQQ